MGDKSLIIRYSLYIILYCTILLQADLSVEQIEQMVEKVNKQREGIDLQTLEMTKEPFVQHQAEHNITHVTIHVIEEKELLLHAIMNSKAYINDSWMSVNDKIMGYILKYIGKRGVVLKRGNEIKKLFLHKKNRLIHLEKRL